MTVTDDPDEYREKWYQHIDELSNLKLGVPPEHMEDIDRLQDQLKDLVDLAVANVEDRSDLRDEDDE